MSSTNNNDPFDYVIIGAGTAGCVLANRLSVDRRSRICLIEAGPADTYLPIHVPPLIGMAIQNPRLNWGYSTAPQRHLDGRSVIIPRGRVLGGSSSINGMVYFRGHPGDFDDWAAAGNPGWRYEDVLPYFKRFETWEGGETALRGGSGPLGVARASPTDPLFDALRIPRQIIVHHERAKLKVDAFRASFGGNHDATFLAEIIHERRAHIGGLGAGNSIRTLMLLSPRGIDRL